MGVVETKRNSPCPKDHQKQGSSNRNHPRSSLLSSPALISPTVSDACLQWLEIQPVFLELSMPHGNSLHNRPG